MPSMEPSPFFEQMSRQQAPPPRQMHPPTQVRQEHQQHSTFGPLGHLRPAALSVPAITAEKPRAGPRPGAGQPIPRMSLEPSVSPSQHAATVSALAAAESAVVLAATRAASAAASATTSASPGAVQLVSPPSESASARAAASAASDSATGATAVGAGADKAEQGKGEGERLSQFV